MSGTGFDLFNPAFLPGSATNPGGGSLIGIGSPGMGQGVGNPIDWGTGGGASGIWGSRGGIGDTAGGAGTGLGWNIGTAQLGLGALGSLGNMWNAFQASQLAKKQFGLAETIANTNLNNQIKSYNTALSDRARARGITEGQSQDQIQSYVDQNRLSRS